MKIMSKLSIVTAFLVCLAMCHRGRENKGEWKEEINIESIGRVWNQPEVFEVFNSQQSTGRVQPAAFNQDHFRPRDHRRNGHRPHPTNPNFASDVKITDYNQITDKDKKHCEDNEVRIGRRCVVITKGMRHFLSATIIITFILSLCILIIIIVVFVKLINRFLRFRSRRLFGSTCNMNKFNPHQITHLPTCNCKCFINPNASVENPRFENINHIRPSLANNNVYNTHSSTCNDFLTQSKPLFERRENEMANSKMKTKNDKNKKDKAKSEKPTEEAIPSKVDFAKNYQNVQSPIYVKIKNKKEVFMILTDEYRKSIELKEEISKIKDIPIENIKLYYPNKRLIEDDSMNHDQQIKLNTILYACFRNTENNEWDNINDVINFKFE